MTIVQIIRNLALALSDNPTAFSYMFGSKEFLNLRLDEQQFPVVCLTDPVKSNSFRSQGGHIDHTYPIVIIFAAKSQLDWTYDQHQDVIALMRASCDEFIARMEADTANIREVDKNFVITDFVNLFDVNISGVMLEVRVKVVNNNSMCIS